MLSKDRREARDYLERYVGEYLLNLRHGTFQRSQDLEGFCAALQTLEAMEQTDLQGQLVDLSVLR